MGDPSTKREPERPPPRAWATIQVRLPEHGDAPPDGATDRLEALGMVLADEAGVDGVEWRDAGTLGGSTWPEVCVYTTPDALESLTLRIDAVATRTFELPVALTTEVRHDDDWHESWKRIYQPQIFGDGALLLRPSWVERRPDDPSREVVLDPGRAFGTGLHESTRLCLGRLCALWADGERPERILDLGCGSGILVLAAARLFPEARLWARDFDPEAVETTDENATLNDLRARIDLAVGTIDDFEAPPMSLVIANIRPQVLIPAAPAIARQVAPGGRVLLSGILVEEAAEVQRAYEAVGLRPRPEPGPVDGEWQAVELRAP